MHNSPSRPPQGELVYGVQPVKEALLAGKEIDRLFIQREGRSAELAAILQLAIEHNVPVQRVPVEKINRLTTKNHQGVAAFLSAITYSSLDHVISQAFATGQTPLLLVLDRVTDVRNFGAIARTAECAGVHAIVIPAKGAAQINSEAVRTSAGALHHIPVCREGSLRQTLRYLHDSGLTLVACTEKARQDIYEVPMGQGPLAIVMGSEEDGISDEILRSADYLARIPMDGKVASLNVSVAAGIILFEALRQRRPAS
jgi:23S rRNA (guanosine2251-2'-O)-methyltransferase